MYKNSEEKAERILNLYKEGVMLTEICELTSSSQATVKKVLKFFDIDYNKVRKEMYQQTLDKVLVLYQEGKSQNFIEKELKLTRKTIRTLLKSQDLEYRDKSDQQMIRWGNEVNHNCLDILTPEALYWIGFLYTDGHISDNRENTIEMTLQEGDRNHLEKLQKFFGTTREIKVTGKDCERLRVSSKRIHDKLKELGFTNRKSWDAIPHDLLKYSKDFWRGCIDGDGGIYFHKEKYYHITICGTLDTIGGFIEFSEKLSLHNQKMPTRCPGKCLYSVSYYGQEALKIATELYKDSVVYLDRKYKVYESWIQKEEFKIIIK